MEREREEQELQQALAQSLQEQVRHFVLLLPPSSRHRVTVTHVLSNHYVSGIAPGCLCIVVAKKRTKKLFGLALGLNEQLN